MQLPRDSLMGCACHSAGASQTQPHGLVATATASRSGSLELQPGQGYRLKTSGFIGQLGLKSGRSDMPGHHLVAVPVGGSSHSHGQGSRPALARWH